MYTLRRALAVCAVFALLAACGDDDDDAATTGDPSTDTSEATDNTDNTDDDDEDAEATPAALTITLADGAIELSADEIAGGAVEVTVENGLAQPTEVDLTHVEDGTPVETFGEGFAPVLAGGPFPDFAIDNAGIGAEGGGSTTATMQLNPGEYVVWAVPEGEDAATAAGFLTATLTVSAAEAGNDFPETVGTIAASDYAFEVDASGPGTYTFVNEGPVQFHHAQIVDFGTNDVEAVEAAFPELITSEDGAPPEGLDPEQIDFEFAGTGVFGPDGKTTFEADFTEGNTYAVVCFIQDRTGGAPHAIANDMYEVFQAG